MDQEGLSRISPLWTIPGADLTRQLLFELMLLQAEGIICKHFSSLSACLVAKDVGPLTPSLIQHCHLILSVPVAQLLVQALIGHQAVLRFPEGHLRRHLQLGEMALAPKCLEIMTDLVPKTLSDHWSLWIIHVRLVKLCMQHSIELSDVHIIADLSDDLLVRTVELYGADELTINSHWLLHAKIFIIW